MKRLRLPIGAVLCVATLVTPSAGAQTTVLPASFTVTAEGDGLNIIVDYPGALPVVQSVSASPWGASAALSSLGSSSAFAGAPYSPFVYSLPGTVDGLGAGELPALPAAPGEVSSSYPTSPMQTETSGPYTLSAVSSTDDSRGSVGIGSAVSGGPSAPVFATAEASTNTATGNVTATATAGVDALDLGGIVDIGNVSSTATISESSSGKPVYRGQTNLGTVTLSGTTVGLVGTNLKLGSTTVSEPLTASLIPVLNTALAASGVTLAYVPQIFEYSDGTSSSGSTPESSKTLLGVDSGALSVTITHSVPGQGTPTVSETLGRVFVTAQNTAIPQVSPPGSTGPVTTGGGTTTPGQTATTIPTSGSVPVYTAGLTSPSISGSSTAAITGEGSSPALAGTGTSDTTAPAGLLPSRSNGNQVASPANVTAPMLSHDAELFYLILVVGALAALAGSQLMRYLGVRLTLGGRRNLS